MTITTFMQERKPSSLPLVSVLVPVYNAARFLPDLCDSLLTQSYQNFEAIFLDDGSTDGSVDVLRKYGHDARISIMRWEQNQGLNRAWLQLLTQMSGKYWCSPGADDVLGPDFLGKRVRLLELHPYATFVHGPPEIIDAEGKRRAHKNQFRPGAMIFEAEVALRLSLQTNHINQPGLVARSDVTRTVLASFATQWRYAPDWFLWILLLSVDQPVLWDPSILYQYRVHSSSLSLHPNQDAVRRAEDRLVPLCALAVASCYSHLAFRIFVENRARLYSLWLRRAATLLLAGVDIKAWHSLAASAFYGRLRGSAFAFELLRHAVRIMITTVRPSKDVINQNGFGAI